MDAIALSDVRLELGGRTILNGVTFGVRRGEFIGVLGPNGAGKTTLFRAILGLIRLARGGISVFGRPATRGDAAIGYAPQTRGSAAGPHLSGWEHIASVADGHRWGIARLDAPGRAEIGRVLDLVGAGHLARRRLEELSGGERQRLLLAQSLVGSPRLLLLDEPLASLDPAHARSIVALVRSVQAETGITVLFSAHELNPILGALDRVLYLGQGQAAIGTVDDVITGPVLSRLYGSPIDVVRQGGRVFVVAGDAGV